MVENFYNLLVLESGVLVTNHTQTFVVVLWPHCWISTQFSAVWLTGGCFSALTCIFACIHILMHLMQCSEHLLCLPCLTHLIHIICSSWEAPWTEPNVCQIRERHTKIWRAVEPQDCFWWTTNIMHFLVWPMHVITQCKCSLMDLLSLILALDKNNRKPLSALHSILTVYL